MLNIQVISSRFERKFEDIKIMVRIIQFDLWKKTSKAFVTEIDNI